MMLPKSYHSIFLFFAVVLFSRLSSAQTITEPLKKFNKIQVSPLINLVLKKGETEHIRIEYEGIAPEKINFSVSGNKLRIYLDEAKYTVKTEEIIKEGYRQKVPIYRDVRVTAYVSYQSLKKLQVRGEKRSSAMIL